MKKFLILFVAVTMLLVTGCGSSNKLECTLEEDGQVGTYNLEFDGDDNLEKATMKISVTLDTELTAEEKEYMNSYMELMCAAYDYEGVDCKVETKTKSVDVVITMNINKMNDADKSTLGYSKEEAKRDAMKKSLEEDGFTCK